MPAGAAHDAGVLPEVELVVARRAHALYPAPLGEQEGGEVLEIIRP